MKPIGEYRWKVSIFIVRSLGDAWRWVAENGWLSICNDNFSNTRSLALRNWKAFAKANKIDEWEVV